MTEAPFKQKTTIYLQGLIFLVVIVWGFMGFEVAQYQLLNLYAFPFDWLSWATLLFIGLIPVLTAIIWRMKTTISYSEPDWDFREREITITEYESMMKQYRGAYQQVLSMIDFPMIILLAVLYIGAILLPFVTMGTTIYLIAATPVIFGLLVVPFGIIFANVLFKFIPNDATPFFSYLKPQTLRGIVRVMVQSPGISWAGLRVTIGESEGYFTVRNPIPVARIEDIESVSRIETELSENGTLDKVVSYLQLGDDETIVFEDSLKELTQYLTVQIVQKTLLTYIEAKGERALLEDVLDDVESYLKRFAPTS
ncbi:MAG: hypothetical protein ACXACT_07100 [Candidatus Thorarchaeota archaeon]|jgi:hypothetical protein